MTTCGIIMYAACITLYSFDFFAPDDPYWQGFNYYALALLDGRLDVPAHAIGYEGVYYEGKVYLNHYGIIPAIARIPFAFIWDLQITPVARIISFLVATVTAVTFQATIYSIYKNNKDNYYWYYIISTINWLFSGSFFLVQRSNIMYEDYLFSLMFVSIISYLFVRHYIFNAISWQKMINLSAFCAGLIVLCRQSMALGMYGFLVTVILYHFYCHFLKNFKIADLGKVIRFYFVPGFILLAFGLTYFLVTFLKYGQISQPDPIGHYGYFLFEEGFTSRYLTRSEFGVFALYRILPNLAYYMAPFPDLHDQFMDFINGGSVSKNKPPIAWALLLYLPIKIGFVSIFFTLKQCKIAEKIFIIAGTTCLSIPILLMLSYLTISARYTTEIWTLLYGGMILFAVLNSQIMGTNNFSEKTPSKKFSKAALVVALVYTPFVVLLHQTHWMAPRDPEAHIAYQTELGNWPLTQEYIDDLLQQDPRLQTQKTQK